jgi:hypothetical protein
MPWEWCGRGIPLVTSAPSVAAWFLWVPQVLVPHTPLNDQLADG